MGILARDSVQPIKFGNASGWHRLRDAMLWDGSGDDAALIAGYRLSSLRDKAKCAVTATGSHSHIATPQFLRFAIATGLKKIVVFFNSAVRFAKKYVVTPEGNRCRDIGQFGRTR